MKFKNRYWLIAVLTLLLAVLPVNTIMGTRVAAMDDAGFDDTSGAPLPKAKTSKGKASSPDVSLYSLRSEGPSRGWYGSQLTEAEQEIYDQIAEHNDEMLNYSALITGDGASITYRVDAADQTKSFLVDTADSGWSYKKTQSSDAGYVAFRDARTRAIHAYIRDFGSMYWINTFSFIDNTPKYTDIRTGNRVTGFRLAPGDYYAGIRDELGLTDEALGEAIESVGANAESSYDVVKAAHEYTVKLISYGHSSTVYLYEHTITGGLLDKYSHVAVCECYAKLFRLLCEYNGVPSVLISGGSKTDSSGNVIADHMWNYVCMDDGKWYLVDCTWDDSGNNNDQYYYFLTGSGTETRNGLKASQNHMPVGNFSASIPYAAFSVPELSTASYGRLTLQKSALTMGAGETQKLGVKAYVPNDGDIAAKGWTYVSSDTAVAEVAADGTITAKGTGTADITVKSKAIPAFTGVCRVTVTEAAHHFDGTPVAVRPACTEDGLQVWTCTDAGCSATQEEVIPMIGEHLWNDGEVTAEPTCMAEGVLTRTCTREGCGETTAESVPIVDHVWDEGEITTEPKCEEEGVRTYHCTFENCTETKTEQEEASGHEWDDGEITTEPTCMTEGVLTRTCTREGCGAAAPEAVPAVDHVWDEGEVTTAPKCEEPGVRTYHCTNDGCTETMTEEIASLGGHVWDAGEVTAEPTCEGTGVRTHHCTNAGCTAEQTEAIAAAGHAWDGGAVTKEPTCEETGITTCHCTHAGCDKTKTEEIEATGHFWDDGSITVLSTCETAGDRTYTCSCCLKTKTEAVPPLGHVWDEGVITVTATCEAEGVRTCGCTHEGCTAEHKEPVPAIGHIMLGGTVTTAPTFTADGVKTYKCSHAGCTKAFTELVAAIGHAWDNGTVTKAATCTADGVKTYKCSHAGCTKTESIPAQGHVWNSNPVITQPACETAGTRSYPCTRPGCTGVRTESITATGHAWDGGTVTTAPTCTTAGVKTYKCTHAGCAVTKTESISAIAHTPGDWETTVEPTVLAKGTAVRVCIHCKARIDQKELAKRKAVVKLNVTTLPLQLKKSTTALKIKSMSKGDSVLSWKSSNTKVLTVNAKTGKMTGRKTGKATITVTMKSGAKATCKVTVQKGVVKTKKLTLPKTVYDLEAGSVLSLVPERTPLTANDKLRFTSSRKAVASVNSKGTVTGKMPGTATITVRSASGKTVKCKVRVK